MYTRSLNISKEFKQIHVDQTNVVLGKPVEFNIVNLVDEGPIYWTSTATTTTIFSNNITSGLLDLEDNKFGIGYAKLATAISTQARDGDQIAIQLRQFSTTGTILLTSPIISVTDNYKPKSQILVLQSSASVSEGSSVVFEITSAGVSDGSYDWTTTGTVSASDFSDGQLSGTFSLVNGRAIVTRLIANNPSNDSTKMFFLEVRKSETVNSTTVSSILGESSSIRIAKQVALTSVLTSSTSTHNISVAYDYSPLLTSIATSLETVADSLGKISSSIGVLEKLGSTTGVRTESPYDWTKTVESYSWYNQSLSILGESTSTVKSLSDAIDTINSNFPRFKE